MRRLWKGPLRSRWGIIVIGASLAAMLAAGTVLADSGGLFGGGNDNPWPYNQPGPSPVLATVGDISCQPGAPEEGEKTTDTCDQGSGSTERDTAQNATAEQVEAMKPALVGDPRRRAVPERLLLGLRELLRQVLGRVQVHAASRARQP